MRHVLCAVRCLLWYLLLAVVQAQKASTVKLEQALKDNFVEEDDDDGGAAVFLTGDGIESPTNKRKRVACITIHNWLASKLSWCVGSVHLRCVCDAMSELVGIVDTLQRGTDDIGGGEANSVGSRRHEKEIRRPGSSIVSGSM